MYNDEEKYINVGRGERTFNLKRKGKKDGCQEGKNKEEEKLKKNIETREKIGNKVKARFQERRQRMGVTGEKIRIYDTKSNTKI